MNDKPSSPKATKEVTVGRSLWRDAWARLFKDKTTVLCAAIILLYGLLAISAAVYDEVAARSKIVPTFQEMKDYQHINEPPSFSSLHNILGTDWSGRSVLVKVMLGAKVSMTVGFMANAIAVPLGMLLGAIAGYCSGRRGGILDDVIVWLYSTLASIPGIILLIAIKFAFKGQTLPLVHVSLDGIHGLYIALGIVSWIGTCRLVRAEVMKIRELDYVIAARATGRGGFAILLRHVMPNVMHIAIISFSLGFVGAVQAEVILSYLNLGVEVGTPSWGTMINSARMDLYAGRWWELTAAVGAMFFLVLALNIFGDRLRDALDPRLKNVS